MASPTHPRTPIPTHPHTHHPTPTYTPPHTHTSHTPQNTAFWPKIHNSQKVILWIKKYRNDIFTSNQKFFYMSYVVWKTGVLTKNTIFFQYTDHNTLVVELPEIFMRCINTNRKRGEKFSRFRNVLKAFFFYQKCIFTQILECLTYMLLYHSDFGYRRSKLSRNDKKSLHTPQNHVLVKFIRFCYVRTERRPIAIPWNQWILYRCTCMRGLSFQVLRGVVTTPW